MNKKNTTDNSKPINPNHYHQKYVLYFINLTSRNSTFKPLFRIEINSNEKINLV